MKPAARGLPTGSGVLLYGSRICAEIQDIDSRTSLIDASGRETKVERRHYVGTVPTYTWCTPEDVLVNCTDETLFLLADGKRLTPYELGWELIDVQKRAVYNLTCVPHNSYRIECGLFVCGERL